MLNSLCLAKAQKREMGLTAEARRRGVDITAKSAKDAEYSPNKPSRSLRSLRFLMEQLFQHIELLGDAAFAAFDLKCVDACG